jgi:hypothetical protein
MCVADTGEASSHFDPTSRADHVPACKGSFRPKGVAPPVPDARRPQPVTVPDLPRMSVYRDWGRPALLGLCHRPGIRHPGRLVSDHDETFFPHGHGRAWSEAKLVPSIGSWRFSLLGSVRAASTVSDIWSWAASLNLACAAGRYRAAKTSQRVGPTSGHRCSKVGPCYGPGADAGLASDRSGSSAGRFSATTNQNVPRMPPFSRPPGSFALPALFPMPIEESSGLFQIEPQSSSLIRTSRS